MFLVKRIFLNKKIKFNPSVINTTASANNQCNNCFISKIQFELSLIKMHYN